MLCKYVLQDGLWDFLTCIPLACSLQALMEKVLNLKPNVNPPPPPVDRGVGGGGGLSLLLAEKKLSTGLLALYLPASCGSAMLTILFFLHALSPLTAGNHLY